MCFEYQRTGASLANRTELIGLCFQKAFAGTNAELSGESRWGLWAGNGKAVGRACGLVSGQGGAVSQHQEGDQGWWLCCWVVGKPEGRTSFALGFRFTHSFLSSCLTMGLTNVMSIQSFEQSVEKAPP